MAFGWSGKVPLLVREQRWMRYAGVIFLCFGLFSTLYYWQKRQEAEKIQLFVQSSFQDTIKAGNLYQNAKDINAIESLGLIRCVQLRSDTSEHPFYTSADFKNCGLFHTLQFTGSNGTLWTLKYSTPFELLSLALYVLGALGSSLILIALFQYFERRHERADKMATIKETENIILKNLAQQAQHDVASPLSAIRVAANHPDIEANIKKLLNMAIERTEAIVLSIKNNADLTSPSPIHISQLLEEILIEKRAEYPNTQLVHHPQHLSAPLALASPFDLKRILSNLINNSVEAGAERVQISYRLQHPFVEITIADDGQGLEEHQFEKALQKGISYSKSSGSGLGLYHAKNHVEYWGGQLKLSKNQAQAGLCVSLWLQSAV